MQPILRFLLIAPFTLALGCHGSDEDRVSLDGSLSPVSKVDGGVDGSAAQDGGVDSGSIACAVGTSACATQCCAADQVCQDGTQCVGRQPPCKSSLDCAGDTYCANTVCKAYLPDAGPQRDEQCQRTATPVANRTEVQCRFDKLKATDPFPTSIQVMATAMVADLDLDNDPATLKPSIVFPTYSNESSSFGVIRVIAGADCSLQLTLGSELEAIDAFSPVALADLTGDGNAEIIATTTMGTLVAYQIDRVNKRGNVLWRSSACGPIRLPEASGPITYWGSPSVHDLNDDGRPEIIHADRVLDAAGCVIATPISAGNGLGATAVVLDIDGDGKVERVGGDTIYEWNTSSRSFTVEFDRGLATWESAMVAVAELGNFPVASRGNRDFPEIAYTENGNVRVQNIAGELLYGPIQVPNSTTSGAPTIADFDGDGRREIGVAGNGSYAVFDLDCAVGGNPQGCKGGVMGSGVLWSRPSQDISSGVTGSSVFDFDGDGRAEVAYADECYFRIYDGATGRVTTSLGNTTLTATEYPVIADVDGDYRSEVVISSNFAVGTEANCPATDPLLPESRRVPTAGITVLRDANDAWAASRPIWNQYAYNVTNVGERGEIPRTSQVVANWSSPTLNNYRQNSQGTLSALGMPDLTVRAASLQCAGNTSSQAVINVCNRGQLPVAATQVRVRRANSDVCQASLNQPLQPGTCVDVSCALPVGSALDGLSADIDSAGLITECNEKNNTLAIAELSCAAPVLR